MERKDLVSVIIPTYNRFQAVQKSINSVLSQTWKNLEVIVVDDCSTQEDYLQLPKIYQNESRVRVIRLDKNMRELHNSKHAQGLTRNEGIKIARGEWIAFLDDDDFYILEDKIELQIRMMNMYNLKACSTNMLTGRGFDIGSYTELYFQHVVGKPINENVSILDLEVLQATNFVNNSTVLLHKSIVQRAGFQKLVVNEDYEYWKECVKYTDFLYLQVPTIGYDITHDGGSHYKYV